jgi:hypothetical protein
VSARSCAQVRADLSAYLDGDLDPGLAGATRAHLDGCSACRSELELLRLTVATLHGLPDLPPPAGILIGVRARLQPESWHQRLLGGGLRRFRFPLRAAATLLVVFGISLFLVRYPDMPKKVLRDTSPQPAAPAPPESPLPPPLQSQARPAHVEPPAPPARDKGSDRQAAPPTAPAVRGELRAKLAPGPSLVQPAQPEPPVAAPKDTSREESRRAENFAAAPPRGSAAFGVLDEGAVTSSSSLEKKKEAPASSALKADSGAVLGYAGTAGEKETAPRGARVVCLLPDGDTVDDLEKVLRREGAIDITVSELEPPAVREALAPYRGRLGSRPEPSRGWTVTAKVPPGGFTLLLDALGRRTGLRMLEQPPTPAGPEEQPERLDLRVTVFR